MRAHCRNGLGTAEHDGLGFATCDHATSPRCILLGTLPTCCRVDSLGRLQTGTVRDRSRKFVTKSEGRKQRFDAVRNRIDEGTHHHHMVNMLCNALGTCRFQYVDNRFRRQNSWSKSLPRIAQAVRDLTGSNQHWGISRN